MTQAKQPKINQERLQRLLKEMVDIYSPSGKEEEVVEYIESNLTRLGLTVRRQEVDENRYNLMIFPENGFEADLCFIGHVDTVSAYDLEDFGYFEEEGTIYGLGTADMKAGCAAMMEAFIALHESGVKKPVGLALIVGEEEDNSGARALMKEYNFPWALIGEPTNLAPCLGHYSYLEVILRTQGKRAHSSMPEHGQNAIETMLKLLLRFTDYAANNKHGLVYNLRELSGFPGGFVVPDACEAFLDIHLPPNSHIGAIKTELEKLVETSQKEIPGMNAELKFWDTYSGYRISDERPLVKKLQTVYQGMSLNWEPQDFRSHSDGNILWTAGVDPIVLGPGRLEEAHTPEESVSFRQVIDAAQIYLNYALSI
ncbi:MAG: M20/M25/M40 family metallo-hydrolase [Dehalococcoidales bacterium]|nr:M20/M25/M40 family metallo-hydrolase [Dehalococcoidales bacterium]